MSMEQVAEVEQFEEKKMFLGLNKKYSCGEKAYFHVIVGYVIILIQEWGEKSFFRHRRFFFTLIS